MIPKIIWQTHEWEYKDLPHNFNRCIQTWKNLNPEWEYRYHSAIDRAIAVRDFDQELYGYYMFADKVTQSDIWRYVVLYQYGGFYTDMDSFCIMPLEYSFQQFYNGKDIFCTKIFYAEWYSEKESIHLNLEQLHNSPIAAIQKSSILDLVIQNIKNKYKENSVLDLYNEIEIDSKGFSRGPSNKLWLGTNAFASVVFNNKENVCFDYYGDLHSHSLKTSFRSNFLIDYYGEEISYKDLCDRMGWEDKL
jgi:mannosyltransferase OCH1-like enzyme